MKHQAGKSTLLIIAIGVIAVAIGLLVQSITSRPEALPELKKTILLPTPKPITMTGFSDHRGQSFGIKQFKGKWSIVFFGFTNCPDICPTTMQTLGTVKQTLAANSAWTNYEVVMVSVDPARDTTERLSQYVPYFDPEFTGLRASVENTEAFAKQLGILFIHRPADENGAYDVDHGAALILIDPQGRYAGVIPAPHKAEEITADLGKLAKFTGPIPASDDATANASETHDKSAVQLSSPLTLDRAWVRSAPPGTNALAAYFTISNQTTSDIIITDASSESFESVMIHDTVIEDGVASMEHLDELRVPAGGSQQLQPMGTHMMLVGPSKELTVGELVEVVLEDEQGQLYPFKIEVQSAKNK